MIIGLGIGGIENNAGNYKKLWFDIVAVRLPETILGTAILKKMLSIDVLE